MQNRGQDSLHLDQLGLLDNRRHGYNRLRTVGRRMHGHAQQQNHPLVIEKTIRR